uniref:Uncharacterized protein n=1 Tax=Eptatretus burgeri TaxID=7764 RepID=A0A8C4QTF5_EPTBU
MYPQARPLGFEDTSVNMTPMPAMKRPVDHLAWSLFNFAFFNGCCLGYVATVFSIRSRDSRQMNDALGAAKHASTAKTLNIISTAIGVIITLILFVVIFPSLNFQPH